MSWPRSDGRRKRPLKPPERRKQPKKWRELKESNWPEERPNGVGGPMRRHGRCLNLGRTPNALEKKKMFEEAKLWTDRLNGRNTNHHLMSLAWRWTPAMLEKLSN